MVKANNFPHSYPKIGVSMLHDAAFLHLPWWKKAKIHRFFKKQWVKHPVASVELETNDKVEARAKQESE